MNKKEIQILANDAKNLLGWSYDQHPTQYSFLVNRFRNNLGLRQYERDYYKLLLFVLGTPDEWCHRIGRIHNLGPDNINYEYFFPRTRKDLEVHDKIAQIKNPNPPVSDIFKSQTIWNPFKELIYEISGMMSSKYLFDEFENLIEHSPVSPVFQNAYPIICIVLT